MVVEAVLVVVTAVLVRIPVLVLGVVVLLHLHLGVAGLTPFFRSGGSGSRPVARGCGQGDWSDHVEQQEASHPGAGRPQARAGRQDARRRQRHRRGVSGAWVSEQTYYRWRNQYGGLKADDAKRLRELEKQNATLKRLLAEAELEKAALKELAEGNF